MSGNSTIQVLRGSQEEILESTSTLFEGQPLYNETRNYLSIGTSDSNSPKKLPITVREMDGYFAENRGLTKTSDTSASYSIYPDDNNSLKVNLKYFPDLNEPDITSAGFNIVYDTKVGSSTSSKKISATPFTIVSYADTNLSGFSSGSVLYDIGLGVPITSQDSVASLTSNIYLRGTKTAINTADLEVRSDAIFSKPVMYSDNRFDEAWLNSTPHTTIYYNRVDTPFYVTTAAKIESGENPANQFNFYNSVQESTGSSELHLNYKTEGNPFTSIYFNSGNNDGALATIHINQAKVSVKPTTAGDVVRYEDLFSASSMTVNSAVSANSANLAISATRAQYASTDTSKGTIEERLTNLGFKYLSTSRSSNIRVTLGDNSWSIGSVTIRSGHPTQKLPGYTNREGNRVNLALDFRFDSQVYIESASQYNPYRFFHQFYFEQAEAKAVGDEGLVPAEYVPATAQQFYVYGTVRREILYKLTTTTTVGLGVITNQIPIKVTLNTDGNITFKCIAAPDSLSGVYTSVREITVVGVSLSGYSTGYQCNPIT